MGGTKCRKLCSTILMVVLRETHPSLLSFDCPQRSASESTTTYLLALQYMSSKSTSMTTWGLVEATDSTSVHAQSSISKYPVVMSSIWSNFLTSYRKAVQSAKTEIQT
jgi:hypothetical protein